MGLFDSVLEHNETLFRNEIVLDYDYLPHILPFRETQQQHIATTIKPLLAGRSGSNLVITGKPGVGKTAACRHVLREMEQHTDKIYNIYVNCWKHESTYQVLTEICAQIGYKWIQNKKTDELLNDIGKLINKKAGIIVLDEVDKLKEEQVIYSLLEELGKKSLILISNEKEFLSYLDQRTRSRLLPDLIEFIPYSFNETYEILEQRKKIAFFDGVWRKEEFEKVVEKTVEHRDIRLGLFLLREAGRTAENRSSRNIEMKDVETACAKIDLFLASAVQLDEDEKHILEIVKEYNGQKSTIIYEHYKERFNKSGRTFRRKISSLNEKGFVERKEEGKESSWFTKNDK